MNNYRKTIEHTGLNKVRTLTAKSSQELQMKIQAVENQWNEQWEKKLLSQRKQEKETEAIKKAGKLTLDLENNISSIEEMLTKEVNLKKPKLCKSFFGNEPRSRTKKPIKKPMKNLTYPTTVIVPKKPKRSDIDYQLKTSILNLYPKRKQKELDKIEELFNNDLIEWTKLKENIDEKNQAKIEAYNKKLESEEKKHDANYEKELEKWKVKDEAFNKKVLSYREKVKRDKRDLKNLDPVITEAYFNHVISNISIPLDFNIDFNLKYIQASKQLYLEYNYPNLEDIPSLAKVTYIKSRNEFKETNITVSARNSLYEKAIYNITLKLINNIFINDIYNAVDFITLNGFVSTINLATGQPITPCFMSLVVKKDDFKTVNLQNVNPKEWFKHSKGVAAAKITSITPIKPIISVSREDSRFIDSYDVMDGIEIGTNLASMDWQDFENLIRDLFEKEFSTNGGEVKITQASKDGGVDAVAFDPDPIRGGKIVIQAKRYTNVVGVSAVRDLYGTVMNEGATKGILVTTSDYGSDSFNFAKNKPLTLLNGGHLLHLLQEHGTNAYIDIKEAKRMLKE